MHLQAQRIHQGQRDRDVDGCVHISVQTLVNPPIFCARNYNGTSCAPSGPEADWQLYNKNNYTSVVSVTVRVYVPTGEYNWSFTVNVCGWWIYSIYSIWHTLSYSFSWCIFRVIRGGHHAGQWGLSDVKCCVCSYETLSKCLSLNHHILWRQVKISSCEPCVILYMDYTVKIVGEANELEKSIKKFG